MKATVAAVLKFAVAIEKVMSRATQDLLTSTLCPVGEDDWLKGVDGYLRVRHDAEEYLRTIGHMVTEIDGCPRKLLQLAADGLRFLDEILLIARDKRLRDDKWYRTGGGDYVLHSVCNSAMRYRLALRMAGVKKSFKPLIWEPETAPQKRTKRQKR